MESAREACLDPECRATALLALVPGAVSAPRTSEAQKEGVAAFLERRPAKFTGR